MMRILVQLSAVFVKEVRQTVQDKRVVALLTMVPIVQVLLFGYAIDFDVDRVPTAIVDLDDTPESREVLQGVLADGTLASIGRLPSIPAAEAALESSEAAVVLIVPEGFARAHARREPARLQVLVDGSDPTRSSVAAGAVNGFVASRLSALATAGPRIEVRSRLFFNPALSTPVYMVPGIAGMLLLLVTTVVTAMGLAREREVGTLEQIRVTPLPSSVLMVGKVTPYILIGLVDVSAALGVGAWLFGVPIRGSLLLFYAVTAAYLLTTVGIGLLISTLTNSQQQAYIGAFMFMLPAMLLSGTMTPVHSMPGWLQPLTYVNPLRYYTECVRAILLKGATAGDLWVQILALVVIGLLVITTATRRFHAGAH
ncbi:MAG: ABC transporter permease [Myxococcota bacterium]